MLKVSRSILIRAGDVNPTLLHLQPPSSPKIKYDRNTQAFYRLSSALRQQKLAAEQINNNSYSEVESKTASVASIRRETVLESPGTNRSKPQQSKRNYFRKVVGNVNLHIEELSHLDDVRKAQSRVLQLKDQLVESGQHKREILHKLAEVRNSLKRVHSDSLAVGRATEGYLALVRSEMELTRTEEHLQIQYDKADEAERTLFTHLTAAINDSNEKEKIHANTLRQWGLIATIITSAMTLILSTIGHYYHTTQIGLVGSKFKETENISQDIRSMRAMLEDIRNSQIQKRERPNKQDDPSSTESWWSYLGRIVIIPYRYFVPKK